MKWEVGNMEPISIKNMQDSFETKKSRTLKPRNQEANNQETKKLRN